MPKEKSIQQIKERKEPHRRTKSIPEVSMPKSKFDEVMKLLEPGTECECDVFFQPRCSIPIQNNTPSKYCHSLKSTLYKLLGEARLCLLQRDWKNFAKIMTIAKLQRKDHHTLFQVFVRYALLYLAHNPDDNLLNMFLDGVVGCASDFEKIEFIKSVTNN
ncbi:uncharacterized protein LOC129919779 [Episyrphus balteatus]|uniref:uncharacterized protein LOC129919779 n=1 Tax=Episyrphus balteatus TaxID=286459 RepID=UPI0024865F47|nr:uncharacterized protein LOC129919779 [Episyrphus balteatus]